MANNKIIENDFESIKSKKSLSVISQNIIKRVNNLKLPEMEKKLLLKDIVMFDNGEREEWLTDFIKTMKREKLR